MYGSQVLVARAGLEIENSHMLTDKGNLTHDRPKPTSYTHRRRMPSRCVCTL